jgi:predicted RNase H-like HicB family nuclease
VGAILFEEAGDGSISAYVEGVPVYAVGETRTDAAQQYAEALALYRASLADGETTES